MLVLGAAVLCVLGVREAENTESFIVISNLVFAALFVLCAPVVLAAFAPEKPIFRIIFLALTIIVGAALNAAAFGLFDIPGVFFSPLIAVSGFGLFLFLIALGRLTRNALRLGVLAPVAALIGSVGGLGYFAMQGALGAPLSAASAAIALASGVTVGAGIGADFARHFARGMTPQNAAAAAGHSAVAPAAFSVFAAAVYAGLVTFHSNFGQVEASSVLGAGVIVLFAVLMALAGTTGGLAVMRPGEMTAVDENRRRQLFADSWKPMRKLLPSTTALAASAIAGVIAVIAGFEEGVDAAASLFAFLAMILGVSGLVFVSIRTSFLITALMFMSTVFVNYIYGIFDFNLPALPERFAALTLAAIAFSQITVSWRNASEIWRNARDITQNAMCDGLRRFLLALSAGGASFVTASAAFDWENGVGAAAYFVILASIGLMLSPPLMIALSARTKHF